MYSPLVPGDESGLLFYFPLDEAGMETGANVIESRALQWYGMLGNAQGYGRPTWVVSDAPLSCTRTNTARACQGSDSFSLAVSSLYKGRGAPPSPHRRTHGSARALSGERVSRACVCCAEGGSVPAVLLLVFVTSVASAVLASVLTYTSIKGELPPSVSEAASGIAAVSSTVADGYRTALSGAGAYTAGGAGGGFSAAPPPPATDWTWASPPRHDQERPVSSGGGSGANGGARSYGGV